MPKQIKKSGSVRGIFPALPFAVIVASFILLGWQIYRVIDSGRLVVRTVEVQANTYELERLMTYLESGLRGYQLTGSEEFLEPYDTALAHIDGQVEKIRALTIDDTARMLFENLEDRIEVWIQFSKEAIALERGGAKAGAGIDKAALAKRGKNALDSLRESFALLVDRENSLRMEREAAARSGSYPVFAGGLGAMLASLAFIALGRRRIKKTVRALEDSEVQVRSLVEQAPLGFFLANLEGRYTEVNDAACEMLGYGPGELIGKNITDLIPQEDFPRLEEARRQLLRPGSSQVAEWKLRKKDGTYIPVEVSARIVSGGRWQAFVRDLTLQMRVQEALKKSEEKFRGIMESAHDAVVITDKDGLIRYANKGLSQMLGYSESELLGRPVEMLIPERYRELHVQQRLNYLDHPQARTMGTGIDLFARKKDGGEVPVDISLSPIHLDGEMQVSAIIRDVSERLKIQLRQLYLADLGKILGGSLDLTATLLKVGAFSAGRFGDWCSLNLYNDGQFTRLGMFHADPHRQELINQFVPKARATRMTPGLIRALIDSAGPIVKNDVSQAALKETNADTADIAFFLRLGIRSYILAPIRFRDRLFGAITFAKSSANFSEDETAFIEEVVRRVSAAIENARNYQIAQEAVKAREDLVAMVSHDLKSPLTVIQVSAEFAKMILPKDIPDVPREKLTSRLNGIDKAAKNALQLIRDLLDTSKIESEALVIEKKTVCAGSLANQAVALIKPIAEKKNIKLEMNVDFDGAMPGDERRLSQVFSNLLGNALKYTPAGGKISIGARHEDRHVVFWVSDSGPGIAPENLTRIFDRYWQAGASSDLNVGLGLSIAKGIVSAHGGRIWAESSGLGEGSTFFFTIPLEEPPRPEISSQVSRNSPPLEPASP